MKDLSQTYESVLLMFCWNIHGMRLFKKNIYIVKKIAFKCTRFNLLPETAIAL